MRFTKPNWQKIMLALFMAITPRIVKNRHAAHVNRLSKILSEKVDTCEHLENDLIELVKISASLFLIATTQFEKSSFKASGNCSLCKKYSRLILTLNHGLMCSHCFTLMKLVKIKRTIKPEDVHLSNIDGCFELDHRAA